MGGLVLPGRSVRCGVHGARESPQARKDGAKRRTRLLVHKALELAGSCELLLNLFGASNQWQSVAISGNQWQSAAISGNQRQSEDLFGAGKLVLDARAFDGMGTLE